MAGKRLTKAQVISELANATDLDKKSVNRVFEALSDGHPQAAVPARGWGVS